jgi:hypothetical protein
MTITGKGFRLSLHKDLAISSRHTSFLTLLSDLGQLLRFRA